MKNIKYYLIAIIIMLVNIDSIYAECTDEEINNLKKETDKIEITYKHLGEVTKEDGNKVYNEFIVTAKNIPDDIYVYLSPMTEEKFVEENNELKIKLTTGQWIYYLHSSKCDDIIDEIAIKLPTFNMYSLDPLCEGVDGDDFKLCGKYYESNVSRDVFERRIKTYRAEHTIRKQSTSKENNKNNIINKITSFLNEYKTHLIIAASLTIIVLLIILIILKNRKRKILQ